MRTRHFYFVYIVTNVENSRRKLPVPLSYPFLNSFLMAPKRLRRTPSTVKYGKLKNKKLRNKNVKSSALFLRRYNIIYVYRRTLLHRGHSDDYLEVIENSIKFLLTVPYVNKRIYLRNFKVISLRKVIRDITVFYSFIFFFLLVSISIVNIERHLERKTRINSNNRKPAAEVGEPAKRSSND